MTSEIKQNRYIISLSSIPTRFSYLEETLKGLLRQTVPAERVIVYIPHQYRRFPDWDGQLPKLPEGVELVRCDQDYGPATKLLPALVQFAGTDVDILFCDDDMYYPPNWAAAFLRQRARQPEACVALVGGELAQIPLSQREHALYPRPRKMWAILDPELRIRKLIEYFNVRWRGKVPSYLGRRLFLTAGFQEVFQGFGGVMVRATFFDESVFDIPREVWAVDDYWLSGNAAKNGHPVWVIPFFRTPRALPQSNQHGLAGTVIDGQDRTSANLTAEAYLREKYGIWR